MKQSNTTFNKIWHGQFLKNYCLKYPPGLHNGLGDCLDESTGFSTSGKINSCQIDSLTFRELIISDLFSVLFGAAILRKGHI